MSPGDRIKRDDDIIFHTSKSTQSLAIQKVTNSKYSHMGIVYVKNDGSAFVYEAVQPVKSTLLKDWIRRGRRTHYVVKHLVNSDRYLTAENLKKMLQIGRQFEGRPYDLVFGWSDNKMYCSELVWKIYKRALGLKIGQLQKIFRVRSVRPCCDEKSQGALWLSSATGRTCDLTSGNV